MDNEEASRITPIVNKIVKWRAILRNSGYLSGADEDRLYMVWMEESLILY